MSNCSGAWPPLCPASPRERPAVVGRCRHRLEHQPMSNYTHTDPRCQDRSSLGVFSLPDAASVFSRLFRFSRNKGVPDLFSHFSLFSPRGVSGHLSLISLLLAPTPPQSFNAPRLSAGSTARFSAPRLSYLRQCTLGRYFNRLLIVCSRSLAGSFRTCKPLIINSLSLRPRFLLPPSPGTIALIRPFTAVYRGSPQTTLTG